MKHCLLVTTLALLASAPLKDRIVQNDPAGYRAAQRAHGGAGTLRYAKILNRPPVHTNFLFLHAGILEPGGGIGHHFHHRMEELYVILDNEAEFTIDGRTSLLKGPAAAPCTAGKSHAIYNPTDKPTRWLNFAVSLEKRGYDSFDLNDDRVGVTLDPKPVFVHTRLERQLLAAKQQYYGGTGSVLYRRTIGPTVFSTNWSYVDHLVIPVGASSGPRKHAHVEEVFYVMAGKGTLQIDSETASLRPGSAFAARLGETQSIRNDSEEDLELLLIGVAKDKLQLDPPGF